jgi:hypothetical protein
VAHYDAQVMSHRIVTKLCALILLTLALIPFTAPFRTCDTPQLSLSVHGDENGVVAPRATETRRRSLTQAQGLVVVATAIVERSVSIVPQPLSPTSVVSTRLNAPTILRV